MKRSAKRKEFLAYLLSCAIEHAGYGQFRTLEYEVPDEDYGVWYAVIEWDEEAPVPGTVRVDIDTMARGLAIIRDAVMKVDERYPDDGPIPHNASTGERLYFGGPARTDLLVSDRTNGEDGDYDVIGALAVLECACFGRVVYA